MYTGPEAQQRRTSDHIGQVLQLLVTMWVLATQPCPFTRAASSLNCRATSPSPVLFLKQVTFLLCLRYTLFPLTFLFFHVSKSTIQNFLVRFECLLSILLLHISFRNFPVKPSNKYVIGTIEPLKEGGRRPFCVCAVTLETSSPVPPNHSSLYS